MANKRKSPANTYSKEALTVILIGFGVLLLLAIISYDRTDNPNLDIPRNSLEISNWLGPLGAAIADPLMKFTLGYPCLFIPLLIIYVAVQIYRNRKLEQYLRNIIVITIWAVTLSVILAMPESVRTYGVFDE
jgi:hypothetical protein